MDQQKFVFPSASVLMEKKEVIEDSKDVLTAEFSSYQIEHEQENRTDPTINSCYNEKKKMINIDDMSSSEWESDQSYERYKKKKKKSRKKKKKKEKRRHETKPNTIWIDETTLDYTQAYRKDKHPDFQNVDFDSLYKMDIALFTPNIEWQCLGLGKKQKIVLYPLKKKKKKKLRSENFRYFCGANSSNIPQDCHTEEFIHNVESANFIPIVINSKDDKKIDVKEHLGSSYLQENKKYSQLLLDDPGNIKLWLEFVDYQDVMISSHVDDHFKSSPTPKAIIEKKASILEKAMLKNPVSKLLIIKYAHLIKEIWPSDKVIEAWKQWMFKFPNSNMLWREYLLYVQSNLLTMKVSSVLDSYRKCFRMLVGICEETIKSHKAEANANEELLLVFLQLVIFLWNAGHSEKCICLFQCLIEFNLCSKKVQFNSLKQKKDSFEEFFNGNASSFGDDGAISWLTNTTEDLKTVVPSNLVQSKPFLKHDFDDFLFKYKQSEKVSSIFKAWPYLEDIRMYTEVSPFKGDVEECEDTERIVLFEDISFALFDLKSDKLLFQLVLSYLLLLGVPVHTRLLHQRIKDCFSRAFHLRSDIAFKCLCHHKVSHNFLSVHSLLLTESGELNEAVVRMARNIMSQALNRFQDHFVNAISEIWLHFESVLFCSEFENMSRDLDKKYWKEMQKFMKTILKLKPNRNCLVLWNMYASYEWNLGNAEESSKICYTALKMCNIESDRNSIFNMATCIRTMVDLQLGLTSIDKKLVLSPELKSTLLQTLSAFINPDVIVKNTTVSSSPVLLLKVHSLLQDNLVWSKQQKPSIEKQSLVDFVCCYIVFEYLFSGVVALQNVFQQLLFMEQYDILENNTEISTYVLLLMRFECEHDFTCFPAFRKMVELCLRKHPQDSNVNHLYMEIKRHGLDSLSARRFYEERLRSANHLNTWLHAIAYESKRLRFMTVVPINDQVSNMQFADAHTGLHNRIVSLYKRMLEKEEHKYTSTLWINYISFLLKYSTKEVAKEALYVALRSNPSSKDVYMFSCKSFDNFQEMYDLMMEKEVRVKLITEELELLWNT